MYNVIPVTCEHPMACGAACLKMLLAYYNIASDMDELISELGIGVAGCTGKDIKRVGDAHGLDIKIYKTDASDIFEADRPCILWWKRKHFVVFCGMDKNGEPVICNPSNGRFSLSVEAFKRSFSNVAFSNGNIDDVFPLDYWGENTPTPDYFDE